MLSACSDKPDLRVAGKAPSPISFAEGKRLLEAGRAAEAVTAFRTRLREYGADLQGLNGLAIAYSELGRPDLAADMFGRALTLKPNDPATLNNIGFSALRRADVVLARHYLEKAQQGEGGFDEIDGNLERLALFETFDKGRPTHKERPAKPTLSQVQQPRSVPVQQPKPAIVPPADQNLPTRHRSPQRSLAEHPSAQSLPASHRPSAKIVPKPDAVYTPSRARPPAPRPPVVVDFTTIIDPFSEPHAARKGTKK